MEQGRFKDLREAVIDPGFCVLCGSCSGFCDRIELDYDKGIPRLVGECVEGCSNCYDQCPVRKDFRPVNIFGKTPLDPALGPYTEVNAVRASDEALRAGAHDGGAVSAIISAVLDRGKVDAAVVVERDESWRPMPKVITSEGELLSSRGSKYSPSPNAEILGKVFRDHEVKSVVLVDVGCHIRALRNLEFDLLYTAGFSPYSDLKLYTIGLFCSGSFRHGELFKRLDRPPSTIERMDVRGGRLHLEPEEKNSRGLLVKELEGAFMPACRFCRDYTAELADLSIGSIGSPSGYSTVIVRNLMGWGMLRDALARGFAEADPSLINLEALKKRAGNKKERAQRSISAVSEKGEQVPGFIQS